MISFAVTIAELTQNQNMLSCDLFLVCCYSLFQAGVSTLVSILLALPVAHFFARYTFWGKEFFLSLMLFFCVMPTKICALSIKNFYGVEGLLGIIGAHIVLNVPFASYILYSAYQKIDWLVVWAAADLGASSWCQFKDIILPEIKSALAATGLTIFLLCFSSFSIPRMLGTHFYHYTPEVMLFFAHKLKDRIVLRNYFILRLFIIVPLNFLYKIIVDRGIKSKMNMHISYVKKPTAFNPNLHGIWWIGYAIFIVGIIGFPLISLYIYALQHGMIYFLYKSIWLSVVDPLLHISISAVIKHSLIIAMVSSISSVFLGGMLAGLQLLLSNNFLRLIIHFLGILPFVLGNVVSGMFCVERGATFLSYTIIIISHIMIHYSFVYRFIMSQLHFYPIQLNQLAESLGAFPYQNFLTIVLPFLVRIISKSWCIAFSLSLVEVGAGAVIADGVPITIPLAMRLYQKHGHVSDALGLSLILFVMVCIASCFTKKTYYHFYAE